MNEEMELKKKGLTEEQVLKNREEYGANTIPEAEPESFWRQFLDNFNDPMIRILCIIAVIMLAMFFTGYGEWYEPVGTIVAILIVNFVNAKTSVANDNAYAELKSKQKKDTAKVLRNGAIKVLELDEIVYGDIICLSSGDPILADGILLEGELSVDNSALNGEAEECKKTPAGEGFTIPENITGDTFVDEHSLFRGATVLDGSGLMLVQAVGVGKNGHQGTMMGKMAAEMNEEEPDSPLKVKLSNLANQISKFGYIAGILIAIVAFIGYIAEAGGVSPFIAQGWAIVFKDFMNALSVAITIIVCAVPEGLPLTIALVLMQNTGKLLKHNVLVRRSIGIETAGSLNILFSDKTGTITKGQLEVVEFFTGGGDVVDTKANGHEKLIDVLEICIGKNTSAVFDDTHRAVGGNMTDQALLKFLGEDKFNALAGDRSLADVDRQDFNSANKFSQVFVKSTGKTYYKGAPERIVDKAKSYLAEDGSVKPIDIERLNQKIDELANRAMRVLAFGVSDSAMKRDSINDNVILVGLVGIRDDVRSEAAAAIHEVQGAGIQVVMITGDRKETAVAIAKEAGLLGENAEILTDENKAELLEKYKSTTTSTDKDGIALTSKMLNTLSDDEVKTLVSGIRVIARALPTDKSRMVRICQEMNLVVGMTGDGVNDSPALKRADVGFAMGTGTAVAKEAGDLVILDDNFRSIKDAIWFGRTIYANILKFCRMQLAINVGAVLISSIGPLIGIESPLRVTHLLFVNLVMDSMAALMMANEPALEKYMHDTPRKRDENILSKPLMSSVCVMAIWVTVLGLVWFKVPAIQQLFATELRWKTGYFCLFIFAAMVNAFNIRSEGANVFEHLSENPTYVRIWFMIIGVQVFLAISSLIPGLNIIAEMFSCEAFKLEGWLIVILMALTMYPVDLIRKAVVKNR